jgi:hypothetical protein
MLTQSAVAAQAYNHRTRPAAVAGPTVGDRRDMSTRRRIWAPAVAAIGAAGLLLAHRVAYLVAVPDERHRDALLARTGHGYMPGVSEIVGALALGAVLALLLSGLGGPDHEGSPSFARLAGRMSSLQVSIFVAMEMTERISSRAPLAEMLHDHVLVIGIAVQIIVAAAGALLLRRLTRAADRVTWIFARSPSPAFGASTPLLPTARTLRSLPLFGAVAVRGPPPA